MNIEERNDRQIKQWKAGVPLMKIQDKVDFCSRTVISDRGKIQ